MNKMTTHLIKKIDDERTVCGLDTIKVANAADRLALTKKFVNCQTCIQKSTRR
jgi:hypothetical protein